MNGPLRTDQQMDITNATSEPRLNKVCYHTAKSLKVCLTLV